MLRSYVVTAGVLAALLIQPTAAPPIAAEAPAAVAAAARQGDAASATAGPAPRFAVKHTYIEMDDGTLLKAVIHRPARGAATPVIVSYGPYGTGNTELNLKTLDPNYAYVRVDIRGTGCSGGTFNLFSEREARDGAAVVEWAASRPWSNGKVGMSGTSYLAITQLFVAAQQPDGLKAIAPFHILGDLYRDVVYPGGVYNQVWANAWGLALQPRQSIDGALKTLQAGDPVCARHQAERPTNLRHNLAAQGPLRPNDDTWFQSRSPIRLLDRIDVPTLIGQAWQDHQLGSRSVNVYEGLPSRVPKKLVLTNGRHAAPNRTFAQVEKAWFDRWLRGVDNGIENKPRVTIGFENSKRNKPNFTRHYATWPIPRMRHKPLYLQARGKLSSAPPKKQSPPDHYVYPGGVEDSQHLWDAYSSPSALRFETKPLKRDTLLAGPWALSLYASTTAVDTDFFVLVSEVDADGDVTYVQKGILRASHRRIDSKRSTPTRPYHTHAAPEPTTPGQIERYDIELLPIGHPFRKGSRLRLELLAPNVLPKPYRGYVPTATPGITTVHHDAEHPSALWLPVIPAGKIPPARDCGRLSNQPCRPAANDRALSRP